MPTQAKRRENIEKHLTAAEISARERAEAGVVPDREKTALKPPKLMAKNGTARRYWKSILERMDGLEILDDLDSEVLGIYCAQLSRLELLLKQLPELFDLAENVSDDKTRFKCIDRLNSLEGKAQALEKSLLTYAEKLGLTPSGRARLAAKRAAAEMEEDPDADLFG